MDLIYIVVDGLIHGLDAVLHKYLTVQQLCVMIAGECLNLLDQRGGLLMGNEFGGLHAIHEKLQLRQFKSAACNIVTVKTATLDLNDIHTEDTQCFDVIIYALALC